MVTDTAPFRNPNYHRPTDTPDTLDYDRMAKVVQGWYGLRLIWENDSIERMFYSRRAFGNLDCWQNFVRLQPSHSGIQNMREIGAKVLKHRTILL